jgi:ketosteroid isomerase-like protein
MTNLQTAKTMYASFESGDMDTWRTLVCPDCVFTVSGNLPISGTFNGPDDIIENCFSAWAEHYSDLSFADVKFWECENVVFAEVNVVGGGLPDGGLKEMHRITIEDGQITEFQDYFDSAPYLAILAQNK